MSFAKGTIVPVERTRAAIEKLVQTPEHRRRWRALLLGIKAKLEYVQSGIATFDEEFLAHIVIDDRTVFDRIREAAGGGRPLLPPIQHAK